MSPTTTGLASCAASSFLNVSGAAGPGGSYAALVPSLSVSCGASTVTVQSNGIPTYQYLALTPNGLQAKNYAFTFPRSPSVAANVSNIPLLGNIGVGVNGIPIYGVNEGPQPVSDAYGNPIAASILDECGSHSAQQGTFHYHKLLVKCLLQSAVSSSQPWNNADPPANAASPIVGYAFDGFPIYGPYECTDAGCSSVQQMRSGWDSTGYQAGTIGCVSNAMCNNGYCTDVMINGAQTTACVPRTCVWSNHAWTAKAGAQYLDRCNGHYGPAGDYHYHTTDTFPYTLGCYRGTATSNGGMGTPPGGTCAAVPTPGATFTFTGNGPASTPTRTPTVTVTATITNTGAATATRTITPTAAPTMTATPTTPSSPTPTQTSTNATTCGEMWDEVTTLYADATSLSSCNGVSAASTIVGSLMDVSGIHITALGGTSYESCIETRCDANYVYVASNNMGHYQYSTNNPRPMAEERRIFRLPLNKTAIGNNVSAENAATMNGCSDAYEQYLAAPTTGTTAEPGGYCYRGGMQTFRYLYDVSGGVTTYYKKVSCLLTNGFVNSGVEIAGSSESRNPDPFGNPGFYLPYTAADDYEGVSDGVPSIDLCGGHAHHHGINERCFKLDTDKTALYTYAQATSTFNFSEWIDSPCTQESGIVGWMVDGVPVKGPCVCMARDGNGTCTSLKRARSSFVYGGLGAWGSDPDESAALGEEGASCTSDSDCTSNGFQCSYAVFNDAAAAGGTVVDRRCVLVDYAWCTHSYVDRQTQDVSATNFVYLDRCNGITGADGYAYHSTGSFPYVPSCFRYEPTASAYGGADLD